MNGFKIIFKDKVKVFYQFIQIFKKRLIGFLGDFREEKEDFLVKGFYQSLRFQKLFGKIKFGVLVWYYIDKIGIVC